MNGGLSDDGMRRLLGDISKVRVIWKEVIVSELCGLDIGHTVSTGTAQIVIGAIHHDELGFVWIQEKDAGPGGFVLAGETTVWVETAVIDAGDVRRCQTGAPSRGCTRG